MTLATHAIGVLFIATCLGLYLAILANSLLDVRDDHRDWGPRR